MSIGDHYRLAVESTFGGDTYVNIFHYSQYLANNPPTSPNAQGVIYYWNQTPTGSIVLNNYKLCIPFVVTVARLFCINQSDPSDFAELTVNASGGDGAGEICPPQCTTVTTWRTGNPGRSFRGRTFLGPIREGRNTSGVIDANIKTAIQALWLNHEYWFNGSNSPYRHVIYSRKLNVWTPTTSYIVRDVIGTQRRRTRLSI